MRDILFRGKRTDNGEWAEGYLYEHEPALVGIVSENDVPEPSKWFIARTGFADWNMPRPVEFVEVDPSTISQYTGLKDKNGKRIFEGDILLLDDIKGLVNYGTGCFCVELPGPDYLYRNNPAIDMVLNEYPGLEIIGNAHDNPELLKEEAQP